MERGKGWDKRPEMRSLGVPVAVSAVSGAGIWGLVASTGAPTGSCAWKKGLSAQGLCTWRRHLKMGAWTSVDTSARGSRDQSDQWQVKDSLL